MKGKGKNLRKMTMEIADRLHSAAIHLLRQVRKNDVTSREAPARLSALSVLVFGGPVTLGRLAAAEQVKPPTMTRIVTGLERSGLAERLGDTEDARRVKIRATRKGVRLLQKARQRRIGDLAGHMDELAERDLQILKQSVEILDRILREWK
jgi:DNA-binding MarR family transcriptional regulator